ncbi:hypothetical protein CCP1ISM_160013 [Azospirillaceae bacterium]
MRCRSYRSWGEALRKSLEASRYTVDDGKPKVHRFRKFLIDYKNGTIKEVLDSDKKDDTISPSP